MNGKSFSYAVNSQAGLPRARARFLQQSIELEETQPPGFIRGAIVVSAVFLISAVIWASFTRVNEVAVSPGEVVPADLVHKVQHLEGGIVSKINVRNGDYAEAGDVLVSFAPSASRSELDQMETRKTALLFQAERLQALIDERQPEFSFQDEDLAKLAAKEMGAWRAMSAAYRNQVAVIDRQIAQRESEVVRQKNHTSALNQEVQLGKEQLAMREKLATKNLVARAEIISLKLEQAEMLSEQRESADSIAVAENSVSEARQRLAEAHSNWISKLRQEAREVEAELSQTTNHPFHIFTGRCAPKLCRAGGAGCGNERPVGVGLGAR